MASQVTPDQKSAFQTGHVDLLLESGSSLRKGTGNPLQYSCPGNPMDTGAWQATVCRVAKSQTQLCNSSSSKLYLLFYWCAVYIHPLKYELYEKRTLSVTQTVLNPDHRRVQGLY